jgi:hypothetical protein
MSKTNYKKVFAIVAIFLCFVIIVAAMMYYQAPARDQTSNQDQTQNQPPSQDQQKTRIEFIVKVTTSGGHFGVVFVEDENSNEICCTEFENDDEATVTNEYEVKAGIGDRVTVEVQFGGYVTVRLVKEGLLFSETIKSVL